MLPVIILVIGILSRLLWHLPNFTPVYALALFGGVYLDKRLSIILPVGLMMITDLILGVYPGIAFTWISMALIACLGWRLREKRNFKNVLGVSLLASLVFFVVSNLGVWILGRLYPLTFQGLMDCYVMAIPFFGNTLISTVVYSVVLILGYEKFFVLQKSAVRNT